MVALTALTLTCTVILGNHFFSPQIHFNYINITVCFFSYFKKRYAGGGYNYPGIYGYPHAHHINPAFLYGGYNPYQIPGGFYG